MSSGVFAALCKSSTDNSSLNPDVAVTRICSKAFCNLACRFGRELVGSTACVKTLLWLTALNDPESKENATRGLLNVFKGLRENEASVAIQSIKYLKMLLEEGNERVKGLVVLALCIISQFESVREQMKLCKALSSVDFDTVRQDAEVSYAYASTVCNMAMKSGTVSSIMDSKGILENLLELALSVEERMVLVVARTIYYCACHKDNIPVLVDAGVVQAVQELLLSEATLGSSVMKTLICSILFNISTEAGCHLDVVNKDTVQMLRLLWENGDDDNQRVCALTCANLSCGVVNSSKIVRQQGTEMLVKLALRKDLKDDDGMRCVAALRNLLSTSANHRPMLKENVVDALVRLAESKVAYINLNAAAALRTMTYNEATREALIEKNAIKVIIDDTNTDDDKDEDDDDLQIGSKLLQQIEAESWSNGSRGIQREGRAQELEVASLIKGLSESEPVMIELPDFWIDWEKVEHNTVMVERSLQRTPKDHDKGGKGGTEVRTRRDTNLKVESREMGDLDLRIPTMLCTKIECDVILEMAQEEKKGHKADFLEKIKGSGEHPGKILPLSGTQDRRRKLSGTSFDVAGEMRFDAGTDNNLGGEFLVLPDIALTPHFSQEQGEDAGIF